MKRYIACCLGGILPLFLAAGPAFPIEYSVSAKGKNEQVATVNAKVNAVRACMNELISKAFLQANTEAIRLNVILKSHEFVTFCNILETEQHDKFISVQAVVDVDKNRLLATLAALQRDTSPAQKQVSSDAASQMSPAPTAPRPGKKTTVSSNADAVEMPTTQKTEQKKSRYSGMRLFDAIEERNKDKLADLIKQGYPLEARNDKGETPVQLAVRYGHWTLVKILVDAGADINVSDKEGRTLLMIALAKHITDENLTMLADKCKNYSALDNEKRSILHYAAASGFIKNTEFALKHFTDIDHRDVNGNTALSVSKGTSGQYLIAKGADPCTVNNQGRDRAWGCKVFYSTPDPFAVVPFVPLDFVLSEKDKRAPNELSPKEKLYNRIENGALSPQLIEEFIASGGDVNKLTSRGELLLNRAAADYSDGYDLVLFLLSHGADIHQVDWNGQSALFHAIKSGHQKTVALLIERGLSVNLQDKLGQSPLFYAAADGDLEVAQLLISHGANVHTRSKLGETAMFWAAFGTRERGDTRTSKMVTLLLNAGAKAHEISNASLTPLWCAIRMKNFATAKLLIEHGAEVNYQTHHRIIDYALSNANFTAYLVKQGIDVNTTVTADSGWTGPARDMHAPLLYWAVQNGHNDLVKVILSKNADVNRKAENGETALLLAVDKNNKTMVNLLLEAGADTQVARNDGQTPLIRAAKKCKPTMVKRLIAAGATITDKEFTTFIATDRNINWMKKHDIYADLMSVKRPE